MPGYMSLPIKQGSTLDIIVQLLQENGTPVPGLAAWTGTHLFQIRTAPVSRGGTVVATGTLTVSDAANAKLRLQATPAQTRLVTRPEYVFGADLAKLTGEVWSALQGDCASLVLENANTGAGV